MVFGLKPGASQDAVWDSEVALTDSAYDHYTDWSAQRNVAVGPDGRIHVVWTVEDYFLPKTFQVFYKRYNPGSGWTQDTCISEDQMALNRHSRYPSLVVDRTGNVHLTWTSGGNDSAKNRVMYKRCTPAGSGNGGWQSSATLVSSDSTEQKFTPDIACSPNGHVHVVWARQSGASYGIHYRESTDGGNNWQTEFVVFDTLASTADQISPTVAVANNNTVHVAWCGHPYFGEAMHLYYRKRINTTWFAREVIAFSSADYYEPSIACSPLTNNPHIVWRRWYGLDSLQIVHSYWDNVWQTVQAISGTPVDTFQMNPQVAFTPDGSAHAVWRGRSVASPSIVQVRYAARSPAGAWSTPIDVSTGSLRSRDYPSIAALGHDLNVVWQDDRGTYQEVYLRHGRASYHDVGCRVLIRPQGTVDSGAVIVPACSLYNYDTTTESYSVRMHIGSGYDQLAAVNNHAGGSAQYVEFPAWTAGPRGLLTVRCSTELATDADRSNDRVTGSVTVAVHDVGATVISAPTGTVDSGSTVTPRATAHNWGTGAETFDISFTISDGYTQTMTRTVAAGADSAFSFPDWVATVLGTWQTRCSTQLTGDMNVANDARRDSIRVIPLTGLAVANGLPKRFALACGPNPFRAAVGLRLALPRPGPALVRVYAVNGRRVRTLLEDRMPAGNYLLRWDGRDDAGRECRGGVYIIRASAGESTIARALLKMD